MYTRCAKYCSGDAVTLENALAVAGLTVSLVMFFITLYYITADLSYTPAEGWMQIALRDAESFSEFNREFPHGGLVSRW